jgi:hypothetical protein
MGNEMVGACSTNVKNAYRTLVGKPEWKRTLRRPRRRWVDNVEMDLERQDGMVWIELIWLRTGSIGRIWSTRQWTFGLHKTLGSSWVAAQLAASQEGLNSMNLCSYSRISLLLVKPKCSLRCSHTPSPVPILNQISPFHTILFYLNKIYFKSHLPASWSSQWSISSWLSDQYFICIPLLIHSCYMPCSSNPHWLVCSNYT